MVDLNLTLIDFDNETSTDYVASVFACSFSYNYVIAPICSFGLVSNLLCLIVFFHPTVNSKPYRYFQAKAISDSILTAIGCLEPVFANESSVAYETYIAQVYVKYFGNFFTLIAYFFSSFCQVLIIYDRHLLLESHNQWKFSRMVYISGILLISTGVVVPDLFAQDIVDKSGPSPNLAPGRYTLVLNSFGKSHGYIYFQTVATLLVELVNCAFMAGFSCMLIHEFSEYKHKKKRLQHTDANLKPMSNRITDLPSTHVDLNVVHATHVQKNITMKVIIIGTVFLISRGTHMVSVVLNLTLRLNKLQPVITEILFCVSFLFIYIAQSINLFIYLKFNKGFYTCFMKLYKKYICF